jgi:hypothetical protein
MSPSIEGCRDIKSARDLLLETGLVEVEIVDEIIGECPDISYSAPAPVAQPPHDYVTMEMEDEDCEPRRRKGCQLSMAAQSCFPMAHDDDDATDVCM